MKDLLDKLSSYNIFNYLLPGILFAVLAEKVSSFHLVQKDAVTGVFAYYFLGSVISRLGSLVIEPLLKQVGFLTFAPYADFVRASKVDSKLELLSETNNMYRTFCALLSSVGLVALVDALLQRLPGLRPFAPWLACFGLLVLYLWSYRKQTSYIRARVAENQSETSKVIVRG